MSCSGRLQLPATYPTPARAHSRTSSPFHRTHRSATCGPPCHLAEVVAAVKEVVALVGDLSPGDAEQPTDDHKIQTTGPCRQHLRTHKFRRPAIRRLRRYRHDSIREWKRESECGSVGEERQREIGKALEKSCHLARPRHTFRLYLSGPPEESRRATRNRHAPNK